MVRGEGIVARTFLARLSASPGAAAFGGVACPGSPGSCVIPTERYFSFDPGPIAVSGNSNVNMSV